MNRKTKLILSVLAGVVSVLVSYIAFHEFGHLIVMLSAGAVIDDFSILGAHVSAHGGAYTRISDMWLHANGAVFPLVAAFLYLAFYRREREHTFYRVFSFFVGLVPVFSLLAWVIVPFAFMSGHAPAGDDVTNFLQNFSQTGSPLLVSAAAALLIGVGVALMAGKGVLKNYFSEIAEQSKKE